MVTCLFFSLCAETDKEPYYYGELNKCLLQQMCSSIVKVLNPTNPVTNNCVFIVSLFSDISSHHFHPHQLTLITFENVFSFSFFFQVGEGALHTY